MILGSSSTKRQRRVSPLTTTTSSILATHNPLGRIKPDYSTLFETTCHVNDDSNNDNSRNKKKGDEFVEYVSLDKEVETKCSSGCFGCLVGFSMPVDEYSDPDMYKLYSVYLKAKETMDEDGVCRAVSEAQRRIYVDVERASNEEIGDMTYDIWTPEQVRTHLRKGAIDFDSDVKSDIGILSDVI